MILVAGLSDELECQICFTLASRGISIRALILNQPDPDWVECLKNYGATLAVGDLRDSFFLSDLYLGVNAVVCTPIFLSTGEFDLIGMLNLIDAAKAAEVLRFVYLSFLDKNEHCLGQEKIKQAIESHIIESGVPYTILHAGDHPSLAMDTGTLSDRRVRIKELARLATQALTDPAQSNAVVSLMARQLIRAIRQL